MNKNKESVTLEEAFMITVNLMKGVQAENKKLKVEIDYQKRVFLNTKKVKELQEKLKTVRDDRNLMIDENKELQKENKGMKEWLNWIRLAVSEADDFVQRGKKLEELISDEDFKKYIKEYEC